MSNKLPKWTDERTAQLENMVSGMETVPYSLVEQAAQDLETTTRSVAGKLRKMGYEVEHAPKAGKSFTPEQEEALREFVENNPNAFTYAEIAEQVFGDESMARKVQGKLLSMELTSLVKKTPPKESQKTYTDEEEAKVISMVKSGKYLEEIAEALGRSINSIRGKCLSLLRAEQISKIPAQRDKVEKAKADPIAELDIENMTVAEIAEALDKSERGVKTILTRRGLTAADYDGAARKEKLEAKKAA